MTATPSMQLPSPPTLVHATSIGRAGIEVAVSPPVEDGGAKVDAVRVEMSATPGFETSSAHSIRVVHEVQAVTVDFRNSVITRSGSFTLSWGARTSPAIDWNADAADVQEAVSALVPATSAGVSTHSGALPSTQVEVEREALRHGYEWRVTFLHREGNFSPLIPDPSLLAGDNPTLLVAEVIAGVADVFQIGRAHV